MMLTLQSRIGIGVCWQLCWMKDRLPFVCWVDPRQQPDPHQVVAATAAVTAAIGFVVVQITFIILLLHTRVEGLPKSI